MSIINAQGKVFRTWEGLINACVAQAALLPSIEPLRTALQDILAQSRQAKAEQENNEARRLESTQKLMDLLSRGEEAARRVRGYAKSQLGTKNELLLQFGAAPIRPRVRSLKPATPVTPAPTP